MITNEMLAADAALTGLTDEQRNAIVLMSKNDEEVTIGNRFREVYNQLDATIAKETGIARNGDEKTYLYLERAAKTLAAKANSVDGLNVKINDLTKERDKLQKALEEGGDDATKKQLAQAVKDLNSVRQQYDALRGEFEQSQQNHAAELLNVRIDNELAGAKAGLKFKPEIPQMAVESLMAQAVAKVKAMNPQYKDEPDGSKSIVFLDSNGATMQNPQNHLQPYTAAELLQKELQTMGILDEGRKQTGAGTKAPAQVGGGSGSSVDVSMARTQNEAQEIIAKSLMQQGMVNGSKEFQEAMTEAWKANNVSSLPIS